MPPPVRGFMLLALFVSVLSLVSSAGQGGDVMAGIFAVAGIPLTIIALRALAGHDD